MENCTLIKEKCNVAIARELDRLHVKVATNVPGSGSEAVLQEFNRISNSNHPVSYHEEVAFTIAHGAALTGARSVCLIKSHGLVKAGNSLMDAMSSGTNAGMVTIVFSDSKGTHSDNIFDVLPFLESMNIPFWTFNINELTTVISDAYETSERLKLPVAIVVDDELLDEEISYQFNPEGSDYTVPFERDILHHLVCPVFAPYQHQLLENKRVHNDIITPELPAIPEVNDKLPPQWLDMINTYRPVFDVFKTIRGNVVCGDTGISSLFAFPPYNCIDITTYMGGSVPLALGGYLAGHERSWAVTGDFSFIAAGYLGLIEAASRNTPIKILVLKNDVAETTGGQPLKPDLIKSLLGGFEENTTYLSINDDLTTALKRAHESDRMEIVVIQF